MNNIDSKISKNGEKSDSWQASWCLMFLFFFIGMIGCLFLGLSEPARWKQSFPPELWMLIFLIIFLIINRKYIFPKRKTEHQNTQRNRTYNNQQEPKLISTIRSVPVSNIEGIRFFENWGNKYLIKIDSIKKIAKYLEFKYKKTSFAPDELAHEREYLIENYTSNLSKANYDLVIKTLTDWVGKGGSFEVVAKK